MSEILKNLDKTKISKWFEAAQKGRQPFFYSSVDIRDSGWKIVPVDTNLFPAGFNNLGPEAVEEAVRQTKNYLQHYYPSASRLAILTENFSRNKYYWDNIFTLKSIIENAGFEVHIAVDDKTMPSEVEANSGKTLKLNQVEISAGKVTLGSYIPDLIIANRDFTSGSPETYAHISQAIIPPPSMGWHTRRKSNHFDKYNALATQFAASFGFDPWLISTIHQHCGEVDFRKGEGLECIGSYVEDVLEKIRGKYAEHKINSEPYIYIKSDSGTFGMGIMTVKSGQEVVEMNKKLRHKMDVIKEGVQNTEVIIQEGVPTIHQVGGKTAEPFIYSINNHPVGAILRVNENRDQFGNLNSPGMSFEAVQCEQISGPCEFSPLGIISRLAGLATLDEAGTIKKSIAC